MNNHPRGRSRYSRPPLAVAIVALLLSGQTTLHAQVVVTNTSQAGAGSAFAVSNSDLFQTNLSSVSTTGTFSSFFTNTPSLLVNSDFGPEGNGAAAASASVGPQSGATIRFDLDLSVHTAGYNVTRLETFAGWDSGRDGQQYTVAYSTVAAPNTFSLLATIPQFNPPPDPGGINNTRVSLTDSSGFLAVDVAAFRYTFTGFENNGTAYREVDAFGTPAPVPEPACVLLVCAAGGLAWRARRRRRRGTDPAGM